MPRILSQKYLSIPVPAATLEQIREAAWQRREPMSVYLRGLISRDLKRRARRAG